MNSATLDLFADPPAVPPPPPAVPAGLTFDDGSRLPLDSYTERAYLSYAMSVVRARALPQVEDGLKPVQRRILYAMHQMRLAAESKHVKSARVVGDVIGKYHPHGDTSVYDAMVRVAQDFSLRYPLVDGQGNFGSRDGDGAAAMRYTECRLTPIAELLLAELDRGTVDFIANYDGTLLEPQLMPARLPFVLLNGASGIAVGMATEMPPHNLREVAEALKLLIRRPQASLEEVLQVMPGPDFPGGGQLIASSEDIRDTYATGRGSLRMRARWHAEELARGQWRIIVDELPHGVSCAQVLAEIETLTNPQPRAGKKELTQEQKNLRALLLGLIDTVRDESSDKAPVRIVLEPKSSRLGRDEFMNTLLAHTSLQSNVPVNLTLIGRDGRPAVKPLLTLLHEWLDFRHLTVERRSRHRLAEVEKRLHILDGRLTAFLHIDAVIRVIREADEPKTELMAAFDLTAAQAEDILEIRLRQLARLEGIRIEKEIAELRQEAESLRQLLDDRCELTRQVLEEITEDAKRYGDDRRTLIEAVAPASAAETLAVDEPVTVILSQNGWVRTRQGHGIDPASINYKAGDFPFLVAETRTVWPLVLIDDHGRAYSVRVADLPGGRGDGVPITTLIELQDGGSLTAAISAAPEARYLFAASGGYGFIAQLGDLIARPRSGKAFYRLEAGERLLKPAPVAGDTVAALSSAYRLLCFAPSELKTMNKGRGLKLIDLADDECLLAVAVVGEGGLIVVGQGRGGKTQQVTLTARDLVHYRAPRARRGQPLPLKLQSASLAVSDVSAAAR